MATTAMAEPFPFWLQKQKLTGEPEEDAAEYGGAVAISGDRAIISAKEEDQNSSPSAIDEGAVYVYDLPTRTLERKLVASDQSDDAEFGNAVALDGNIALIGADEKDAGGINRGGAYLFNVETGTELHILSPSVSEDNAEFGAAVDVEGNYAAVAAPFESDGNTLRGVVYVFNVTTGAELFRLTPSDASDLDVFGLSVAITGNLLFVGAPGHDGASSDEFANRGLVYAFDLTNGNELGTLVPSVIGNEFEFGWSLAADAGKVIVGAPWENNGGFERGAAYVFNAATRTEVFRLVPGDAEDEDLFGHSVALGGDAALVGALLEDGGGEDRGAGYLFDSASGAQVAKLVASDAANGDELGQSVAVSSDYALIGTEEESRGFVERGAAYLFEGTETNPAIALLKASLLKKAKLLKKKATVAKRKGQRANARRLQKKAKKLIRKARAL